MEDDFVFVEAVEAVEAVEGTLGDLKLSYDELESEVVRIISQPIPKTEDVPPPPPAAEEMEVPSSDMEPFLELEKRMLFLSTCQRVKGFVPNKNKPTVNFFGSPTKQDRTGSVSLSEKKMDVIEVSDNSSGKPDEEEEKEKDEGVSSPKKRKKAAN